MAESQCTKLRESSTGENCIMLRVPKYTDIIDLRQRCRSKQCVVFELHTVRDRDLYNVM